MSKFILKADNVTIAYNGTPIIKNVDLEAFKGDFIGIVGPNGSGKTTLLRSLTGNIPPLRGKIFLNSQNIQSYKRKEIAQKISVVPQIIESNFPLTVEEVIFLAQEPEVLILDEPTTHLDISFQLEILEFIKEKQIKGLTVIAVFHDLNLASQYCRRIIFLKNGEVRTQGIPEDVLTADIIKDVFGIEVEVDRHPRTNMIYIHSIIKKTQHRKSVNQYWFHLVCGMGSGTDLMNQLVDQGHKVTCGVINVLDTDEQTAGRLGLEYIAEAPFSEITKETDKLNRQYLEKCDYVVLLDIPFGPGNLKNLKATLDVANKGKKVFIFRSGKKSYDDYTNGLASKMLSELERIKEVQIVNNINQVINILVDK